MSQKLFAFPFPTPYDVQVAARSFLNGRICLVNEHQNQQDLLLKNATNQQFNNNNNASSPTVTALEIPTGCGKTAIALSACLHAQNIVAHQYLISERLRHLAKLKAKREARLNKNKNKNNSNNKQNVVSSDAHQSQNNIPNKKELKKRVSVEEKTLLVDLGIMSDSDNDDDEGDKISKNNNNKSNDDSSEDDESENRYDFVDPDNDTRSPLASWQDPGADFVLAIRSRTDPGYNTGSAANNGRNFQRNNNNNNNSKFSTSSGQQSSFRDTPQLPPHLSRILFLSRTHSQIKEVTRELRKFKEAQQGGTSDLISTAVMASRREYCLHAGAKATNQIASTDGVSYQTGNSLGEFCDKLVKQNLCGFHAKTGELTKSVLVNHGVVPANFAQLLSMGRIMGNANNSNNGARTRIDAGSITVNNAKPSPVWDIEDLCAEGANMKACPYYTSRELIQSQRMTFMPYNYLLDPIIRHETKIEKCVKDSIVVIDEAHNIADVLQDSFSFQYPEKTLDSAITNELIGKGMIDESILRNNNQNNLVQTQLRYNETTKAYDVIAAVACGDVSRIQQAATYPKDFKVKGHLELSQVFQLTFKMCRIVRNVLLEVIANRPMKTGWNDDSTMKGPEFVRLLHKYYCESDDAGQLKNNNNNNQNDNSFKNGNEQKTPLHNVPSPFCDAPKSRIEKRARNSVNGNGKRMIIGNYELDKDDPAFVLDICASVFMTFGVTFNPYEFSSLTISLFKTMFVGLLFLVKFPESYAIYSEDVGGGGDNKQMSYNQQQQQQQKEIQLHLRCLDTSIGWRHLRRTVKHITLMSGTLGSHEILSRQLNERFDLFTHIGNTANNNNNNNQNQQIAVAKDSSNLMRRIMMIDTGNNILNSSSKPNSPLMMLAGTNTNTSEDAALALLTKDTKRVNNYKSNDEYPDDDNGEDDNEGQIHPNTQNIGRSGKPKAEKNLIRVNLPDARHLMNNTEHVYSFETLTSKNFFRGSHVVNPATQCRAVVVTNLIDGQVASCTNANRNQPRFLSALARTIATLINNIPHGTLVFCPSYAFLRQLFREVQDSKIVNPQKKLLIETAGNSTDSNNSNNNNNSANIKKNNNNNGYFTSASSNRSQQQSLSFPETMEMYKREGESFGGAAMFCVFRGKVSEGINLPDNLSRGVICVGVPLRVYLEPAVQAQRRYYAGSRWYENDAIVSVNQAIGRALRHRRDYGAIILVDSRYANANANATSGTMETTLSNDYGQQLPGWLKPHIKFARNSSNSNCGHVEALGQELCNFFVERRRNVEKERYEDEEERRRNSHQKKGRKSNNDLSDDDDENANDDDDDVIIIGDSNDDDRSNPFNAFKHPFSSSNSSSPSTYSATSTSSRKSTQGEGVVAPFVKMSAARQQQQQQNNIIRNNQNSATIHNNNNFNGDSSPNGEDVENSIVVVGATTMNAANSSFDKPVCQYDARGCIRENPQHFLEFAHPNKEAVEKLAKQHDQQDTNNNNDFVSRRRDREFDMLQDIVSTANNLVFSASNLNQSATTTSTNNNSNSNNSSPVVPATITQPSFFNNGIIITEQSGTSNLIKRGLATRFIPPQTTYEARRKLEQEAEERRRQEASRTNQAAASNVRDKFFNWNGGETKDAASNANGGSSSSSLGFVKASAMTVERNKREAEERLRQALNQHRLSEENSARTTATTTTQVANNQANNHREVVDLCLSDSD